MNAADVSIVESYETLGMSPEDIAKDQALDLSCVKACLMQFSVKYRNLLMGISSSSSELDFSSVELKEANQVILDLMRYSEDDRIRAKLAMYIRDDSKGRLDAGKALLNDFNGNLNINVLVFNERLQKAREARQRTIDIMSTVQTKESVAA